MARTTSPEQVQRWQQLIVSQSQSGLSVPKFCLANDLNASHFYVWRRKLADRNMQTESKASAGLVPVRIVANSSSCLCIRFASGATIEAPASILRDAIEQILISECSLRGVTSC